MEPYPRGRCIVRVVWVDTETTGLETDNSGAFEIAFLIYDGADMVEEKLYHLNPLNDQIKFGEEAFNVNGVPEETIRSYPPAEKVIPEIVEFLDKYVPPDGLVFAGYKCGFDYGHLKALFDRYGEHMETFFSGRMIDVLELVKRARAMRILKHNGDNQLTTLCKALEIPQENAHTALDDIKATRKLYEAIYMMGRKRK
jgi:DNA polymerase III epsilon subunit-like protein